MSISSLYKDQRVTNVNSHSTHSIQPNSGKLEANTATKPLTLAVMDFDNNSQDPSLDGFRLGFRDMLVTDLSRLSSIDVLERGRLNDLLKEHELAKTPFINAEAAVRLGKGLSAKQLLTGSYVIVGDEIRVDIKIVSVETGKVVLADSVTGKKSEIFRIQQGLSSKVLSGLNIQPSDLEQEALNEPQTKQFDAFRLYSDARLAQLQGQREEAAIRFKDALQLDPKYTLASRTFDRFEAEAIFRLSESQKQKVKTAGEIGRRLHEHWNSHQEIVEQNRGDAHYYASLIVLAAHAGLFGDFDQERQILISYWKHFSDNVPAQNSHSMAQEIRQLLLPESKFFQDNVDSGNYDILISGIGGMTPTKRYLKTELQGAFQWPKWSLIWPFAQRARVSFGQSKIARSETVSESWKSSFESQLPLAPHDYLASIIDYGHMLEDHWKNPSRFIETLRICFSIARYYTGLQNQTPMLANELKDHHRRTLSLLAKVDASQINQEVIGDALPVLESLAKTETEAEMREQADKLLVRFIRQSRINEGLPSSPSSTSVDIYGKSITGSPILVVWNAKQRGGLDSARSHILKNVLETFGDFVRALPGDAQFNFIGAGFVNEGPAPLLFEKPCVADFTAKKKALEWLSLEYPSVNEETQSLAEIIEKIISEYDDHTQVVIVTLNKDQHVPQSTIDFLLRKKARPRFLVIATEKNKELTQLAAASNGAAILLETERGIYEGEVTAKSWDITDEKSKQSLPGIIRVEPTDLTIEDFGLDARIENHELRLQLRTSIARLLTTLDPQRVSSARYFASLTLLAHIAARIGNHPLEDALTRKWWQEIETLAAPEAAIAYELKHRQARDHTKPLLLELKELLRDEFQKISRVDGFHKLPKPKLAPDLEPYIWASPIFWLRGISQFREEMGYDLNVSVLNYHRRASPEFNSKFINPASTDWMHGLMNYYGGVQSGRPQTALQVAELALQLCNSIPLTDKNDQKWLLDSIDKIQKTRHEILSKSDIPINWVAPTEYSPRRPWRGISRSASMLPMFGKVLKADTIVVICDMTFSDTSDNTETLRGIELALNEAGEGCKIRVILSGRQIKTWPDSEGFIDLNSDAVSKLSIWINEQRKGLSGTSAFTQGTLAKAIDSASIITDKNGKLPSSIALICQEADLEKFEPSKHANEIPIHTFAIPRLGSRGGSRQEMLIEKMRLLAKLSGGQFTVVSDDWIWLYLSP